MNDSSLSRTIDGMRLPLIYLVVVAHLLPFTPLKVVFPTTGNELYVLIAEMISHHVSKLSVRCYFFISGYYFFRSYNGNILEFSQYQFKSKLKSLLIPFLSWNVLAVVAVLVKNFFFLKLGVAKFQDSEYENLFNGSFLRFFWSEPANFPLWFVRDLMCMVVVFPLILYFIKLFKKLGVIILATLYLFAIESNIQGFSTSAIFFFSTGAYFAIYKKNILQTFNEIRIIALLSMVFFLVISLCKSGTTYHEYYVRAFIISGVISIFNLFAYLEQRNHLPNKLLGLSSVTFFIYVSHEIYIINWLKGFFYNLKIYENGWLKLAFYFIIPILCISMCVLIYCLLLKLAPRIMSFILGGRRVNYQDTIHSDKR